jgi:adhesin/invasin
VLDSDGQPIEGVTVTFTLGTGATGASASFLGGTTQATATTNGKGNATSPPFLANTSAGPFTAAASIIGVDTPVTFTLTNHAAKLTINAIARKSQKATIGARYLRPLEARVLDSDGQPIEGATVTFTLPQAATGDAGATFADGSTQTTASTDSNGQATSPPVVANKTAGRFTASAGTTGNANPASYTLENLAGEPASISAGAASGESTAAGARFPIPLAATVTDAQQNPVAGAVVLFAAPARGPSGHFNGARAPRTVRVKTNADGIAIAPAFTANGTAGGYIVTASTNGLRASFALINDPRR